MPAPRSEIPIVVLSETSPTSPVSGATAVVKNRATGTEANVYENSGATETKVTQPLTSNTRGALTGWLTRGAYTVEITLPGKTPYTEYLDMVPGSDESIDTNFIAAEAITGTKIAAALKNPAAGTAGLRTIGTGATEAAAGNDSRFTNERSPTNGSVSTVKIVDAAVTEAKLQNESVSLAKMTAAAKAPWTQIVGNSTFPRISRGVVSIEIVQPGGQITGSGAVAVGHSLGVSPASIQLTPIIAANYGVGFDQRVYEINSSYFAFQVYSTQMPSERVVIQYMWLAVS